MSAKLSIFSCCFALSLFAGSPAGFAQCIAVVDIAEELPHSIDTANGTTIEYFYNLEKESYLITWNRGAELGGPHGPYILTRGCAPATLRWESDQFVLLEAGCGTFCWYVLVVPLARDGEPFQIDRPLAFDPDKNLLAFYAEKDVIRIRNLASGRQQDIRTTYECESFSGLCFDDPRFVEGRFLYTWRDNGNEQALSADLHRRLMRR